MISFAKLFKNGKSQAVRLPKDFRFHNQKEVMVKKVANGIVLIESKKDFWEKWFNSFDKATDDFLMDREQIAQKREEVFDEAP